MKKTIVSITLLFAAIAAFTLSPLVAANDPVPVSKAGTTQISGCVFGHLDLDVGAWVGHAVISIGNKPAKLATIIDRNTSAGGKDKPGFMFYGTEVMTLTFIDGSGSFDFTSRFRATPESDTGVFVLHEFSTIGNGKGDYSGISGNASIEGPFVGSVVPLENGVPLMWISTVRGEISGPNVQ